MNQKNKVDIGQVYGLLTVVEFVGRDNSGKALWRCSCECGGETITRATNLKSGNTKSCGHKFKTVSIGQKFDRLTVIEFVDIDKHRKYRWKCLCDCGNYVMATSGRLNSGHIRSCGCLHIEAARQNITEWSKNNNNNFGESNPNYNYSITDEERQATRKYPEYTQWRKEVFYRDAYTCQSCGSRGNRLNAHHIESYAKNKDLRVSLDNGITLCKQCHKNLHHVYGLITNKENLLEFLGEI